MFSDECFYVFYDLHRYHAHQMLVGLFPDPARLVGRHVELQDLRERQRGSGVARHFKMNRLAFLAVLVCVVALSCLTTLFSALLAYLRERHALLVRDRKALEAFLAILGHL